MEPLLKSNRFLLNLEKLLFFLTILAIPIQLGRHFWPDFAFIYSLKIDYLSPTVHLWDLLVILLLSVWLISKPKINKLALSVLLIFFFSQILSLIFSQNPLAGLVKLSQLIISSTFGFYIASKSLQFLSKLLFYGLGISLSITSSIAISQFLIGGSLGLWILGERSFSLATPSIATFNWYGQVFLRPYGTFPHPNVLAAFFVIFMPVYVYFQKANSSKIISKLPILLAAIATILTFSRANLLVLFTEIFYFLQNKKKILAVIVIVLLPLLFVRFESAFNFDLLSIARREQLAEVAIFQFLEKPLFGIGLNNFINNIASSDLISGPSRFLQPVHNIFLLSLVETGLIGFGGFLLLLTVPIIRAWKNRRQSFYQLILFLYAAIFFLGFFDHYLLSLPQGNRIFFTVWGLSMLIYLNGSVKKSR